MSDFPPPPPIVATDALPYATPPNAPRPRPFARAGPVIAWCVIAAAALLIFGLNFWSGYEHSLPDWRLSPARRAAREAQRKNDDADMSAHPGDSPDLDLTINSRLLIGVHALSEAIPSLKGTPNGDSQIDVLRAQAPTTIDKMRLVPVLAELMGAPAALRELDAVPLSDVPGDEALLHDSRTLRLIYTDGPGAVDPADRARLVDRYGWYATLALAWKQSAGSPTREAAMAPAMRAVWTAFVFGGTALTALLSGLALFILALILFFQGKIRSAYAPRLAAPIRGDAGTAAPREMPSLWMAPPTPPPGMQPLPTTPRADPFSTPIPAPLAEPLAAPPGAPFPANARGGPFIEAFAIYLAGPILFVVAIRPFLKLQGFGWNWALLAIFVPFAIAWPRLRGIKSREWRRAIGWHTGRGVLREMGCGALGYLAGLPVFGAGLLISLYLASLTRVKPTHPITLEFGHGYWLVVQALLLACVQAPIVEETMFRGAMFHSLRRFGAGWRWLPSTLLVSLIFAAIHPQGWTMIPGLGSLAIVLAAIREWRGTIIASATAHFIQNFTLLLFIVLVTS